MRVLVIGAYGLIGSYVVARLLAEGHAVVGAGRDVDGASCRLPRVTWTRIDLAAASAADWMPRLSGIDAVINCAGALQDGPRDDLKAVHVDGLLAVAHACIAAGVRRFVHVSAVGVDTGTGAFNRTKAEAENVLAALDLDWVILRPALVLAPAAYGGSALLRGLAAFPWAIPTIHATSVVQVVSVEDVAICAVQAIRPGTPARLIATLVSAESTSLADILRAIRAWLGLAEAPVLSVPPWLGRLSALAADGISWLGWRSPMRSATVSQLASGVCDEADDGARHLGFQPRRLEDILSAWPSGVQERWFGRLYFLKPVALATLAAFWFASGVIGIGAHEAAAVELTKAGFGAAIAEACVFAGAIIDIVLGVAVCFRRAASVALKAMILVTALYLAGATIWRPDLWSDPMGPLIKSLPTAVLALVALAIIDER